MKYIITESRMDELINNFISQIVNLPLKKKGFPTGGIYWTNSDGDIVFEVDNSFNETDSALGVDKKIWHNVKGMFSLDPIETDKVITKWMNDYSNMKFDYSTLYTF